jgi:hypothetical protein
MNIFPLSKNPQHSAQVRTTGKRRILLENVQKGSLAPGLLPPQRRRPGGRAADGMVKTRVAGMPEFVEIPNKAKIFVEFILR